MMTASGLSSAIETEIKAIAGISITNDAELKKFCDAIGKAVVEYVTANALVNVTGVATAVQTGASTAPVTGTGTIT